MTQSKPMIKAENKGEYLLITYPPYKSVSQMEQCVRETYDAVDEYNCRKLLVDLRATKKQVPIMELYEFCLYVVAKFGPAHAKIAAMASPEAVYPDRFGENVIRNRGIDLIRFVDNEKEALDWLLAGKPVAQSR
jgi:hypothetical protein